MLEDWQCVAAAHVGILSSGPTSVPGGGTIRTIARRVARATHTARERRNPLDPHGVIATTLAREPVRAMDVGAAGGVARQWRDSLMVMEVDCFEPDEDECALRQRDSPPNVHWFPVALAGSSGPRPFYVLNRPTGSSLFPPNDPVILEYSGRSYAEVRQVIEVDCRSLSDFLDEYRRPVPALMKLDTQGTELEILSSLTATQMEAVACIETEVEFVELYRGQPVFHDIDTFMRERGFRLLDLRTHRSYRNADDQPHHFLRKYLHTAAGSAALSAELVAGDALYFRESALQPAAGSTTDLIRNLCLLRLYRFYDLALWLVERAAREQVLGPSESVALIRDITAGAPRPTLAQRAGRAGDAVRRGLWVIGRDDREVFWTRRRWPDQ
jgi:FkbM family methyltransferase